MLYEVINRTEMATGCGSRDSFLPMHFENNLHPMYFENNLHPIHFENNFHPMHFEKQLASYVL